MSKKENTVTEVTNTEVSNETLAVSNNETVTPTEVKKEEKPVIIILDGKWGRKDKNVLLDVTANLKLKKKITNKNMGIPDPLFKVVKELFVIAEFKGVKKDFHFMENEFLDIDEAMFQETPAEEVTQA